MNVPRCLLPLLILAVAFSASAADRAVVPMGKEGDEAAAADPSSSSGKPVRRSGRNLGRWGWSSSKSSKSTDTPTEFPTQSPTMYPTDSPTWWSWSGWSKSSKSKTSKSWWWSKSSSSWGWRGGNHKINREKTAGKDEGGDRELEKRDDAAEAEALVGEAGEWEMDDVGSSRRRIGHGVIAEGARPEEAGAGP